APAGEQAEQLRAGLVGLLDYGGDVVVVVAKTAVACADLAAVYSEHDQDHDDQDRDGRHRASRGDLIGRWPAAGTRGPASSRRCTRLVSLVEERQALSCSLRVPSGQYDRRYGRKCNIASARAGI